METKNYPEIPERYEDSLAECIDKMGLTDIAQETGMFDSSPEKIVNVVKTSLSKKLVALRKSRRKRAKKARKLNRNK